MGESSSEEEGDEMERSSSCSRVSAGAKGLTNAVGVCMGDEGDEAISNPAKWSGWRKTPFIMTPLVG